MSVVVARWGLLLLAAVQGGDAWAAAPAQRVLAWSGEREFAASIGYGDKLPLRIALEANQALYVEATSAQVDLAFDVRDDNDTYASESPASVAGVEFLALPATAVARVVELDLRLNPSEGGRGDATLRLLAADDPRAGIAQRWAEASRGFDNATDSPDTRARAAKVEEALALCAALPDPRCQADAQLALGGLYTGLTKLDEAQEAYAAAIDLYVKSGAVLGEVQARNDGAGRLYYRGEMDQAEAIYQQCSDIAKAHGLSFRHAVFEDAVAVMRHYAGDLDQALEHYQRALAAMGDMRIAAAVYVRSNIGGVYELRGDAARAKAAYQDAMDFAGEDPALRAPRTSAKSNLGAILADLGEKQAAITLLSEAAEEFRALGSADNEARVLGIIAYQYIGLRRYSTAESLLKRGLALCQQRESLACLAGMNSNLGLVARAQGRPEEAERAFRLSLEQAETIKAPQRIFLTARRLAELLLAQGKAEETMTLLNAIDAKWNVSSMPDFARRFTLQRGRAQVLLGRSDAARTMFETVIREGMSDGLNNATTSNAQLALARLDAQQGAWPAVEARAAAEVERIAKMRQEFLDPVTRAEFLATQQEIFQLLIRTQLARHRAGDATALAAAFEIEERSRSRALLDALANADATRLPANAERAAARDALRIKSIALDRATTRATQADAAKLDTLRADVALARVALESIEARDLALRRGRQLGVARSLDDTRAMLGANDALLVFHVREGNAWVWVITPDATRLVDLPDAAVVAPRVSRYAQDIRDGGRDTHGDGGWLHATLIEAAGLPGNVTRITIVPDGALHGLPFPALVRPDGRYLIEAVEVAQLPSASVGLALQDLRSTRPAATGKDVVVFADPVFSRDDPRMQRNGEAVAIATSSGMFDIGPGNLLGQDLMRSGGDLDVLPRLPGTAKEAEAIVAAFGADRVQVFSGFEATLEAARGQAVHQARILHFATHGVVNPAAPELTGLALSRWQPDGSPAEGEGFLGLAQIGDARFQADLVVLSACDSAVGQQIESEGMMGLARAFLASGARSVVATLWPVSDRDTAKLEARFAAELQLGKPTTEALALAQREAIADPGRRKPRSWAAFGYYGSF